MGDGFDCEYAVCRLGIDNIIGAKAEKDKVGLLAVKFGILLRVLQM